MKKFRYFADALAEAAAVAAEATVAGEASTSLLQTLHYYPSNIITVSLANFELLRMLMILASAVSSRHSKTIEAPYV